jgi:hypothetical protein
MMRRYLPWVLLGGLAMAAALGLGLGLAGAPVAIAPACQNTELVARVTGGGGEASQPFVIVAVTNDGPSCSIEGYPRIVVASGLALPLGPFRPLRIKVVDGAGYEHPDPGPHQLTLSRGSAVSFALGSDTDSGTIYLIRTLSFTLPGYSSPLKVSVRTPGSAFTGLPIRLPVTAFVQGSAGPPTG